MPATPSAYDADESIHLQPSTEEATTAIPKDSWIGSTLALLRDPYRHIGRTCRRLGTDIYETRLLGERVVCMSGSAAARIFYDNELFERKGAAPKRLAKSLFGVGGVQSLDGASHQTRKGLFMSIMTPERLALLEEIASRQWRRHPRRVDARCV